MHGTCRLATRSVDGVHWRLRRNCSVSPAQTLVLFLSLSAVSMGVALLLWFHGATLVLPFAALESLALGSAFVVYARHATDGERISLVQGRLVVEQESAGRVERCEFASHGLQVEPPRERHQLVEVRSGGRVVRVGRHLRPDLRPQLAREIRHALLA